MFEFLTVKFPVSGVEVSVFLPPLISFMLAYLGAMAGVTGAFLLLPFQMSFLGYRAPGVSATNFCYNLFAIPATVYRYAREGRMNWPLALVITFGSLPGIAFGYLLRILYLSKPEHFLPFAGVVLLGLAWIVGRNLLVGGGKKKPPDGDASIATRKISLARVEYYFDGETHGFAPVPLFILALFVGVVGGAYGIGGGAILAPFCVSVLRLPVHSVAGASLFGTFMSSLAGVTVYHFGFFATGGSIQADYMLGTLFGLGGLVGGYFGAKTQRFVPEKPIKIGLLAVLIFVSFKYILSAFN